MGDARDARNLQRRLQAEGNRRDRTDLPEPYEQIHAQTMMPVAHLCWSGAWTGDRGRRGRSRPLVRAQGRPRRSDAASCRPGSAHLHRGQARRLRTLRAVIAATTCDSYEAPRARRAGARLARLSVVDQPAQGRGVRTCGRDRHERDAGLRPVRIPQRRRLQRRPASARRAVVADHDQQRPHPGQCRDLKPDERRAGQSARLSRNRLWITQWARHHEHRHAKCIHRPLQRNQSMPLDHLADALFHKMGADGVYARTALYEDVVERLAALITRHREPNTEVMRFPPVMSRGQLEKSGYLKSFPNLLGCVCGLHGTEARDPRRRQPLRCRRRLDDVALARRSRAVAGRLLSGLSDRREPRPAAGGRPALRRRRRLLPPRALAPSRPAAVLPDARICLHRHARTTSPISASAGWCARRTLRASLGLAFKVDYASDPFFGRVGQMKAVEPDAAGAEIRAAGSAAFRTSSRPPA